MKRKLAQTIHPVYLASSCKYTGMSYMAINNERKLYSEPLDRILFLKPFKMIPNSAYFERLFFNFDLIFSHTGTVSERGGQVGPKWGQVLKKMSEIGWVLYHFEWFNEDKLYNYIKSKSGDRIIFPTKLYILADVFKNISA